LPSKKIGGPGKFRSTFLTNLFPYFSLDASCAHQVWRQKPLNSPTTPVPLLA